MSEVPRPAPPRRRRLGLGVLGVAGLVGAMSVVAACSATRAAVITSTDAAKAVPAPSSSTVVDAAVATSVPSVPSTVGDAVVVDAEVPTPVASRSTKVLFDSNRTGNYEVFTMDLTTGVVTQLTSDPAYDSWWARISPSGTEMIFNRTPAGLHDTDYSKVSLWKANIDGSNARQIIANQAHGWVIQGHAEWSPDGTELVMYGGHAIWVTDADGNLLHPVTNGIDPIWSRDGSRIIYVKCANAPWCTPGTHQLASIAPDGSSPRDLTPVLPQLSANDPTMSPDGTTITWEASISLLRWDLMAVDSDGTNLRTLFTDDWTNTNPVWTPDGTRIVFFKNKPFHEINIWSIRPDGTDLTLVTQGQPGINEMPDVAPVT